MQDTKISVVVKDATPKQISTAHDDRVIGAHPTISQYGGLVHPITLCVYVQHRNKIIYNLNVSFADIRSDAGKKNSLTENPRGMVSMEVIVTSKLVYFTYLQDVSNLHI